MQVEGVGLKSPRAERVELDSYTMRQVAEEARRRESARRYAGGRSAWRRGLTKSPTLRGLVGEQALAAWLSKRLGVSVYADMEDRRFGDGGVDFRLWGRLVQCKCRARRYGAMLIRRLDESGTLLPLGSDFYVQTTWEGRLVERPQGNELPTWTNPQVVTIDGYVTREVVAGGAFRPARMGDHRNLEVPDCRLSPVRDLAILAATWRDGR